MPLELLGYNNMDISKNNLSQLKSVVLVGAGKMGMAMARGWLKNGLVAKNLTLVDPNPHESVIRFAKENAVELIPEIDNIDINILVLAVKPQIMGDIFPALKESITSKTLVISVAAGITIAQLEQGLGTKTIARAMPNTPAQLGKGVTGIVAAPLISEIDKAIIDNLLSACGTVEWFDDEDRLNAMMLVSGCGPAYVFLLLEAMAEAGIEHGLEPSQAKALARQTIIGGAALLEAEPTDAAILRQNVTSKGGVTEAALSILMDSGGFKDLMSKAFKKGLKRNWELGKND